MDTAPVSSVPNAPPPPVSDEADGTADMTTMRAAMLDAIGELSDDERERLTSPDQPAAAAQAWRDLVAERAAREREASVRAELMREFQTQAHATQPRPTAGLSGAVPRTPPRSVAEWTDYIRQSDDVALRQRRRSQFADWLVAHPDA